MTILIASIVIGPLMMVGALPAAAGLSIFSPAPIQLAAADSTFDRDTYLQKARDEIQAWQQKLHDFSKKAVAKGKEAGNAAEDDLDKAWTKAEAASQKLQTAGAGDWAGARSAYENASHDLADAWDKVRRQSK
jgi:hypothetical protein